MSARFVNASNTRAQFLHSKYNNQMRIHLEEGWLDYQLTYHVSVKLIGRRKSRGSVTPNRDGDARSFGSRSC